MAVDFKDYARRMEKALDHLAEEFGAAIISHFPALCIGNCPQTQSLEESQLELERTFWLC